MEGKRTRLRVDTWYDISCDRCGLIRSTDFGMGMSDNIRLLRAEAKHEGWRCIDGKNTCPNCYKRIKR